MSCFNPLTGYQAREGGEVKFFERGDVDAIDVRCGTCMGCRLDRAREWAVRCTNEAKLYNHNRFLTLTYRDEKVPEYGSLRYRDVQMFLKRLRKKHSGLDEDARGQRPIRYFVAGEYGELTRRPHYHMLLFNFEFPDEYRVGERSYHSDELEETWELGHCHVDDVTAESIGYVSRYALKKVYGRVASEAYYSRFDRETGTIEERVPEFVRMSLKPGIGADWFERYESDFCSGDFAVVKGSKVPMPKYYRRKLPEEIRQRFDEELEVFMSSKDPGERSEARLAVREEVREAKLNFFTKRGL